LKNGILICWILFQFGSGLISVGQSLYHPYLLSGTYCKSQNDIFSVETNPAILSRMKHFDIGIFVENKYLLKELNAFQLVAVHPTRFISLGGQLNRFGNSYYSKYDLELDFSKHLSSMADLAIGFNYTSTQIKSSNTLGVLSGNVSMLFNTSEITMGFCIKNIHSFPLNNGNKIEQLSEYTAGIGYQASDNFF